jgi:hypothetical protein
MRQEMTPTKPLLMTLLQREWLQHQRGWLLLAAIPVALASLLLLFAQVDVDIADAPVPPPVAWAMLSLTAGGLVYLGIAAVTALIMVFSLGRRDHADRSVEFWLSLPTPHVMSLGVPLAVHVVLVPIAFMWWGVLAGGLASAIVVSREAGLGAWLSLPWAPMAAAGLSAAARLTLGIALAALWLAPLWMTLAALCARLGAAGIVVMVGALGFGSSAMKYLLGQPLLGDWLGAVMTQAREALMGASHALPRVRLEADQREMAPQAVLDLLGRIPGWAGHDALAALQALASPVFAFGLLLAAGGFAYLVFWRSRGAGV